MPSAGAAQTKKVPGRSGLLLSAIECFSRYGYAGTSIDRIAREAGVTKGALYYHFRDKEHLLFEAVSDRIKAFEEAVGMALARIEDPEESMSAIANTSVQSAQSDNHRRFILTLMVEAMDTNEQLAEQFRAMMRRFRNLPRRLIQQGQEAGRFDRKHDATLAAEAFVAGQLGAELQHYQDPEGTNLRRTSDLQTKQFLAWLRA
jgi:AcrR family transcriptional regulator